MPHPPVYVVDAAVQPGPLRTRSLPGAPLVPLRTMMHGAARRLIEATPDLADAIDGIHVGTMGVMQSMADDRLHVSHLGHDLQRALGLRNVTAPLADGDEAVHTEIATSDAGAAIFQRAVRHVRAGRHRTVLVVAGEQMLGTGAVSEAARRDLAARAVADVLRGGRATRRLAADLRVTLRTRVAAALEAHAEVDALDPSHLDLDDATVATLAEFARRDADRDDLQRAIRSVVAPRDSVVDGFTMLHVGDLLMDALVRSSDVSDGDWRAAIATTTLRKYAWGHRFAAAFQSGVEVRRGLVTDADLAAERHVTPWFTKHDVGAPCNGATAIVLTSDADLARRLAHRWPRACRLRVDGLGEGHAPLAVSDRGDANGLIGAMRTALGQALGAAGADPRSFVGETNDGVGVLHDAFPSIELSFLGLLQRAVRPDAPTSDVVRAAGLDWLRGRSNPLGGLCAAGHAVGNSGLLQIAKVHFVATRRPDRVAFGDEAPAATRWLATSVGAAVTNVRATVLTVTDADNPEPSPPPTACDIPPLFDPVHPGPISGTRVAGRPVQLSMHAEGLRLEAVEAPTRHNNTAVSREWSETIERVRASLPERSA